jgi:Domain of unknown function (DUF4082)/Bacterial Ig domain
VRLSLCAAQKSVRIFAVAALVSGLLAAPVAVGVAAAAGPCDAPVTNPVACENTLPGNPSSDWDVSGSGSSTIQGFTTQISVNAGETAVFKVKTPARTYRLDIYRMGYYGGNGARKVATVNPSAALPQTQPSCVSQSSTGLVDCGNWAVSASWAVPSTAVSGIYFAKLVRTDGTAGSSHVAFVVRSDASHSALLFQTSDTTWQAYNQYGGNSLYVGNPDGRAYKVSYNRPITTRGTGDQDFVFNAEYPMVRLLEANGYDLSYLAGVDTDRRGSLLGNHQAFLSVGHDEYWSGQQRANVESARDHGVNLAFFSGNEAFWKTRYEPSIDGSATAYRTLVTYKETHANGPLDPLDTQTTGATWTGTWRDPRFSPPADGGRPENAMTGTSFFVNSGTVDLQVPAADGKLRLWRGTSVAAQAAGAVATLGTDLIGYEWDVDPDNGARPAGTIDESTTAATGVQVLVDQGTNYADGVATHHVTMYRAASGALVFGAGTVQWSWGLDSHHDRGDGAASQPVQQATVNLFADMGVQPSTLQAGLAAASASTDTTAPTAAISSPAAGATVQSGASVTVSGTAADSGATGSQVGGVEVSTDNGTSWHPASGRGSWSYTWHPGTAGTTTIKARATDDSLNTGAAVSIPVTVAARSCPCSIWDAGTVPSTPSDSDTNAVEVGLKFRTDTAGVITGLRFYKGSGNTGTHVGHLWTDTGTQLGAVTFTGETGTGWQQANFATPIAVTPGTTYLASYYAPAGHYASDDGYFVLGGHDSAPLHALAAGVAGANGVYTYSVGSSGGFPSQDFQSTNYWVDVVFSPGSGGATPPPPTTTPPPPTSAPPPTTPPPTGCPCTIWPSGAAPQTSADTDTAAVEVGVKLKADAAGTISGIRFYKGSGNTGTHTGHLWTAGGTLLGSVTFSGETASGWQQATFATPITISAGTVYIASYHAPSGHYADDTEYFAAAFDRAPLHALADGVSGANGVYHYGAAAAAVPSDTYQASNYWVDVVFTPSS